jgi:hypothetical protein
MAPLMAFNPPLGVHPQFCFPEENVLHMKEKAFSLGGDDFTIKTANGTEICKCKGKILSISDKKGKMIPNMNETNSPSIHRHARQ